MSRSSIFQISPTGNKEWYVITDTRDGTPIQEVHGRQAANHRCKCLNAAMDRMPQTRTATAVAQTYQDMKCSFCSAAILVLQGDSPVCSRCRKEIEDRDRWEREVAERKAREEAKAQSTIKAHVPLTLACVD